MIYLKATTQTRSNFINTKEQTLMARKHMDRGYCSQVVSREVFCHEYGKIPRHTGQNPITEGDLEWILTKLL